MNEQYITEADLDDAVSGLDQKFTLKFDSVVAQLTRMEGQLSGLQALAQAQLEAKAEKAYDEGKREQRIETIEGRLNKLTAALTAVGLAAVVPLLARLFEHGVR